MLVLALSLFVAGVFLLQQCTTVASSASLGLAAAAAAGLLSLALGWRHAAAGGARLAGARHAVRAAALLLALVAGFSYAGWRANLRLADALDHADEGRDLQVTGVVETLPIELERGVRFEFALDPGIALPAGTVRLPQRISLAWYQAPPSLRCAQRYALTVRLKRPQATLNPAGFDLEEFLFERDLRATGVVRDGVAGQPQPAPSAAFTPSAPRLVDEIAWHPLALVDRARQQLRARLQEALGNQRYAPVLIALVIGDQGAIGADDWSLFNLTGIGHLVSISGLHITMIAGLGAALAGLLWRRSPRLLALAALPAVRAAAAAVTGFAYCMLAGWGVPAQRTFFMLCALALALCWRQRAGAATILALGAAAVSVLDPWGVVSAGFWLSFGAVATIMFAMHGRLGQAGSWRERLAEAARVQWTVTLGLVPATIIIFQQVSLVSPLANAVAIPVVSLLVTPLALAGAGLLLVPGLAAPAALLLTLANLLFELLARLLHALVALPWASLAVPATPWWTVALAVAALAWMLAPPGWPLRLAGAIGLLPLLLWPQRAPLAGELWVTALDVGQGMALLVESRDAVLLFDTGPRLSPQADAGARVIVPYLRWRGIDHLDLLVISHLDLDHSGGAPSVLAALPVAQVLTSIDPANPLLARARRVVRCEAGQHLALGSLALEVMQPAAASYQRRLTTNQRSCVVRASLGAGDDPGKVHRVLLTGDVPAREEQLMIDAGLPLRAQLMVAPHHGSRTSSSDAFIAAVAPRWASVQTEYRSRFGHPHPSVVARYLEHGVQVLRSDQAGAVQWRFLASGDVEIEAWRRDHARYWHNQAPPQPMATPADPVPSPEPDPDPDPEAGRGAVRGIANAANVANASNGSIAPL